MREEFDQSSTFGAIGRDQAPARHDPTRGAGGEAPEALARLRIRGIAGRLSKSGADGTGASRAARKRVERGLSLASFLVLLLCTCAAARAQVIETVAGGFTGDGGPATSAALNGSYGVAADAAGHVYIADTYDDRIRKVGSDGTITTVAGAGVSGYSGDGGPATSAELDFPNQVAVGAAGTLYIADSGNNRIREVATDGTITTVAGNGTEGYAGDGGPATSAELDSPKDLAVDAAGALYIVDSGNNCIRKVGADGTITTVAGNGTEGYSGDGGLATAAQLDFPEGVAIGAAGNLYVADTYNSVVREVATDGTITTVAGNGDEGYSGDGGPATDAELYYPTDVAIDAAGDLYIADDGNDRVREVTPDGTITTVAGNGTYGSSGDGGPATSAELSAPSGLAFDASGTLYIADAGENRIRKVVTDGTISTVAGNDGFSGDGGPATSAQLRRPRAVAIDAAGNQYISDTNNDRVREVAADGTITTIAGNGAAGFSGDGGPATSAALDEPYGVAIDAAGNLLVADTGNNRVREVAADGTITTIAGNGTAGFAGDGGPAMGAELYGPAGICLDAAGNLYIVDTVNNRIREVTADGTIITVAGNGTAGFAGDGARPRARNCIIRRALPSTRRAPCTSPIRTTRASARWPRTARS